MHRYQHLMVGLTRGEADAGLIRYAALVARLGTVNEVRFVHVLPSPDAPAAARDHDRVLGELQAEVHAHFSGVPEAARVHCDVLKGPLLDRLLVFAAEQEVDLLLVGHRPDHPGTRSLARRLAMKAPCSVWMVPDGSPASLTRILVPIDFSEHTADSLQVATSLAQRGGHAECLALHVYFDAATVTYEGYDQVIRDEEDKAYRRFITPLNCHGVRVTPMFAEGAHIVHVIGRVTAECAIDLVVMATRGRSRSAAILLGSVTEEAIIETRVPLLVVKHFGARMGVLQALLDRSFRQQRDLHFD